MSKPNIFSKTSVFIFSILGSTFFGALVYSSNLQTLDKRKFILPTIAFSLVWNIAFQFLLRGLELPIISYLLINTIGGLILIKPFWNYHFKDLEEYSSRKIWGPTIALILPISILLALHFLQPPSLVKVENQDQDFSGLLDSAESNAIFIKHDSVLRFEGLLLTLPSFSYYHTLNTEYLDVLNSTIYFENGFFNLKLMADKNNKEEVLNLNFLKSKVDSISILNKSYTSIRSSTVGYYESYESDTLAAGGQFLIFQRNTTGYLITTDYPMLNLEYGDSLSDYIFKSIDFHN